VSNTCDRRVSVHDFHIGDIVTASDWDRNDIEFKRDFVRGKVMFLSPKFVHVKVLESVRYLNVGQIYYWFPERVKIISSRASCTSSLINLFNE
jgi:hypothetical protein